MPPQERQRRAIATLEWRQKLSASWQLALSDGATDMVSLLDFDLREQLRGVLEETDEKIAKSGVPGNWQKFDKSVHAHVDRVVLETFAYARKVTHQLNERVAVALTGHRDGSYRGTTLAQLAVPDPDKALDLIKPMSRPHSGDAFARGVNSLRGAYGGILMVGVLTSLTGMQLISVYSVGAGVLLGLFTWWEDRKNGKDRAKAEARVAVAKMVDEVNFRVGEEFRAQMRAVHRDLRDHYTVINDYNLRAAAEEYNAAMAAR